MSGVLALSEQTSGDLAGRVRDRIATGAPVQELEFMDMPMWLFAHIDLSRPVQGIFCSEHAGLVIYADGDRLLKRAPAGL